MKPPKVYREVKFIGKGKALLQRVHLSSEGIEDKHARTLWKFFKTLGNSATLLGLDIEIHVKRV